MLGSESDSLNAPVQSETFPVSPRVIYGKNPLREVICQLRFPPILRIESEPPAAFQDRIRHEYPLFRQVVAQQVELPAELGPRAAAIARSAFASSQPRNAWDFLSADETWKVSLNREFVALTATVYNRWEEFRRRLDGPLTALREVYAPTFFTRVGLRYIDVIQRSVLGLEGTEWSELLQPHLTGMLSCDNLKGLVQESFSQAVISLSDGSGSVRLRHGLAGMQNSTEEDYLIDSDFFAERTDIDCAISILNRFNGHSGKLFRWCIQDRLHQSMRPQPVDAGA